MQQRTTAGLPLLLTTSVSVFYPSRETPKLHQFKHQVPFRYIIASLRDVPLPFLKFKGKFCQNPFPRYAINYIGLINLIVDDKIADYRFFFYFISRHPTRCFFVTTCILVSNDRSRFPRWISFPLPWTARLWEEFEFLFHCQNSAENFVDSFGVRVRIYSF